MNQSYADAIQDVYKDGDLIWVHDYHLMMLPQMLRNVLPSAKIGFFLHLPFPSSEVTCVCVWCVGVHLYFCYIVKCMFSTSDLCVIALCEVSLFEELLRVRAPRGGV